MAKEQAILELVVDQSDLLKDAASSKKAILDLKDAQSDLNKEFKKGTIDVEEYATESVKLEQKLKKEQATYSNLTKAINTQSGSLDAQRLKLAQLTRERNALDQTTQTGIKNADRLTKEIKELNAEISKQEQKGGDFRRNVGNYGNSLKDAAANANIAGVNIGSLTSQISSFANPATAAIGILTGLAAAYARSTIGAKDLQFAQTQLSIATTLLTNEFAALFSSAEDGEGAVTKLLNNLPKLLLAFGPAAGVFSEKLQELVDKSKELALIEEQLEDLRREELKLRTDANERLSENQEILTEIQSDQTDYNAKIGLTNKIITNLNTSLEEVTGNLNQQLDIINDQIEADGAREDLLDQQLAIEAEIEAVKKDAAKRIETIRRLEQNLTEEYRKQQAILNDIASKTGRRGNVTLSDPEAANFSRGATPDSTDAEEQRTQDLIRGNAKIQIDTIGSLERAKTELERQESEKRIQQAGEEFRAKAAAKEAELNNFQRFIDITSGIFDEQTAAYKFLASGQALVDTYRGATAALAPPPVGAGPLFGPILAAATIASGLANVAKINGIEFADGGWTGPGHKYQPAGIVHADEYVTPKHIVNSPMAKPHLAALERMRTGYADGGFVTGQNISAAQQNLQLMNAMRNAPAPVVSVVEITRKQERVGVRETVSKLGSR